MRESTIYLKLIDLCLDALEGRVQFWQTLCDIDQPCVTLILLVAPPPEDERKVRIHLRKQTMKLALLLCVGVAVMEEEKTGVIAPEALNDGRLSTTLAVKRSEHDTGHDVHGGNSREPNDSVEVASHGHAASPQGHEHLICLRAVRCEQRAFHVGTVDKLTQDVRVGHLANSFVNTRSSVTGRHVLLRRGE